MLSQRLIHLHTFSICNEYYQCFMYSGDRDVKQSKPTRRVTFSMEHTGVSRKSPNDSPRNAESNRLNKPISVPLPTAVTYSAVGNWPQLNTRFYTEKRHTAKALSGISGMSMIHRKHIFQAFHFARWTLNYIILKIIIASSTDQQSVLHNGIHKSYNREITYSAAT